MSGRVYSTDLPTHSWRNVENSAVYLLPHLRPGLKILDVGCSTGSLTIDMAKRISPRGQVTGIEHDPDPLDDARDLAADLGVSNVQFRTGDMHSLEFPDNEFDIVHAQQALQYISHPINALREMRRVTKRGGIVAIREPISMTWHPESPGLSSWRKLSVRIGQENGGNPDPGNHLQLWARKAGFAEGQISFSKGSWTFSSAEERAYLGGSEEERVVSSGFTDVAVHGNYATRDELYQIASAWQSFVDDDSAWFCVEYGEIICRV